MLFKTEKEKPQKTPYQKKLIKDRRLFNNYLKFSFYLLQPQELTISDLLIMALKWDTSITHLPQSDTNKSVVLLFKRKKSVLLALDALENISEQLLDTMFDLHQKELHEKQNTQNIYLDAVLRALLRINKADIKNVRKYVENFVYNEEIIPTALWNFCNESWKRAVKTQRAWLETISSNTLIQQMLSFRTMKIEEWLIRNIHPSLFDEEKYREIERNDELQRKTFYSVARIASSQKPTWQQRNGNKFQTRDENKQHQKPKNFIQKREKRRDNNKKSTRDTMFEYMNKQLGSEDWKEKYCGFHHYPATSCKRGDKCKRSHQCPRCNGEHTIDKCDQK